MIIFDFSQMVLTMVHTQEPETISSEYGLSMIRHLLLNQLCSVKMMIDKRDEKQRTTKNIVLACDAQNYWRKQIFPYYKQHRKTVRSKSDYDYKVVFSYIDTLIEEMRANFPYRVLKVFEAEADDIVAALAMTYHKYENIYIISRDKDFIQLQQLNNVHQYDTVKKSWIVHPNPRNFLVEHIIRGDGVPGDGIPNCLSDDDSFVNKKRQKSITKEFLEQHLNQRMEELTAIPGFSRNKKLIDFSELPEYIVRNIVEAYDTYDTKHGYSKLYSYFTQHRMSNLLDNLQDF